MTLYDWPLATAFGRVIPKNKIYEHAGANTTLKDLFVRDVDQIVWSHKLAPETINLAATKQVAEIQVFRIVQKIMALDRDVLRAIDRAIPFPLIFELTHGGRIKLAAAYKRPSEADSTRWVVGDYFESGWLPVACFDRGVTEDLVKELAKREPLRVVFRDNGFVSDAVKINVEQIFRQLSPTTEVKAI